MLLVVIVFLLFLAPVLDNWYEEDRVQERELNKLTKESIARDRMKRRY
jgi:hypothetical protein